MNTTKPVVLIAPLDWGLGHTVRCIPIIRELQENGCEVLVACDSKQKQVLISEFPLIRYVYLRGYNIRYGKNRLQTLLQIFLQGPKILMAINRENDWLRKFLLGNRVNAIISDNRYGFFSVERPSIFMTHQLRIISGFGKLVDGYIQKVSYFYINKFTSCWIPDWKGTEVNAGGKLSHPFRIPQSPVKYIGCLSRLEKCISHSSSIDLLIILSGPEPQRTIFEKIVLEQLKVYTGTVVLVRGVFGARSIDSFSKVTIVNNASAAELNRLLCSAEIVLSRSGYTSIMDVLKLQKISILIPTPGQAEQEYLATYLYQKKLAYSVDQHNFSLDAALRDCRKFVIASIPDSMDQYKNVIEEFANSLKEQGVNHRG